MSWGKQMSKRRSSSRGAVGRASSPGGTGSGVGPLSAWPPLLEGYSLGDKVALVWFFVDALTHLTIELGYLHLALTTTAVKSSSFLAKIWNEYARADRRWQVRDVGVISVEAATVFVGLLCVLQLFAVYRSKPYRHALQIVICVAELYGGWMTFAPEWLSIPPNPNLNGSDPLLLWVYLWFMNGLWVVVPAILLWDSWAKTTHALSKGARGSAAPYAPSSAVWIATAGLIALYGILVPAVLGTRLKF